MRNNGFTTVLLLSNPFCIDVTSMTVFFFSDPWTTYHFFLTFLTANILTFLLPTEKDGKLPFLDVDMTRSNGKFSTSIYRKPTFTGLFTNFHSFIPLAYKRYLISCLLYRIFNLCSSYENFHIQLEVIRKLFNLNGFPSHMFHHLAHRFLNKIFEPKLPVHTAPKKVVYFCLPFTGSLSSLALSSDSHSNHSTLQCCLSSSQHSICLSLL